MLLIVNPERNSQDSRIKTSLSFSCIIRLFFLSSFFLGKGYQNAWEYFHRNRRKEFRVFFFFCLVITIQIQIHMQIHICMVWYIVYVNMYIIYCILRQAFDRSIKRPIDPSSFVIVTSKQHYIIFFITFRIVLRLIYIYIDILY